MLQAVRYESAGHVVQRAVMPTRHYLCTWLYVRHVQVIHAVHNVAAHRCTRLALCSPGNCMMCSRDKGNIAVFTKLPWSKGKTNHSVCSTGYTQQLGACRKTNYPACHLQSLRPGGQAGSHMRYRPLHG